MEQYFQRQKPLVPRDAAHENDAIVLVKLGITGDDIVFDAGEGVKAVPGDPFFLPQLRPYSAVWQVTSFLNESSVVRAPSYPDIYLIII